MKHIIIGNGPAGLVAAETLRRLQPAAEIALIGDEKEPPYSRMAIPYFLIGNITDAGTHLRKAHDHYVQHRIHLIQGRVTQVDPAAKQIEFTDGERLPYDKLLIATGSHPIRPPIPGMDDPAIHSCWTLDDARAIAAGVKPGTRVVQMGAGFIGCIIMEALAARGAKLTVVEMGDRMVPRMMNPVAGNMIARWCERKGVRVHTGARVKEILRSQEDGGALCACLESGDRLVADMVISATGVRPNIAFLEGSGIATHAGVLVDQRMQTSLPDIYAAGDVAEAMNFSTRQRVLNAIQPNATEQARIAALNMAGEEAQSQGSLAINVLDTLGLISASFGQWQGVPGGDAAELVDAEKFKYLRLEFQDDVLIGANSVGLTDHVGALRGLIQTRTRLGAWKQRLLADPTVFMAAYLATAQKAA
ncbi:MAG: FAD-dependent oxidoreductase [Rhodocyclaceae bacterium]|nr:FAD-dependent oxidoreductase [Rhodocyclaceae bacterium]